MPSSCAACFLGNAPLFAQQGNDAVKFHCHLVAILHTLPERSAQRPHRVCATSPGRRGRTFRRFLQHLRGRHAPAVLFSALRVCTAACRLTPCRGLRQIKTPKLRRNPQSTPECSLRVRCAVLGRVGILLAGTALLCAAFGCGTMRALLHSTWCNYICQKSDL